MADQKTIVDILGKKELSVYDVGTLLGYAGELAKKLPDSILLATETAQLDAQSLVGAAEEAIAWQKKFLAKLEVAEEELYKRYDDLYKQTIKKRREIADKLNDLEPIPDLKIPYNIKDLCDIADRFGNISDEAWDRVCQLAKALK